jgi:phosphoribosylformylglycinamidine synthase
LGLRAEKTSAYFFCPTITPPSQDHPRRLPKIQPILAAGMAPAAEFLALPGSPAFSPFRLARLKYSLNASLGSGPKVTDVRSIHVHYVSAKSQEALGQLKEPGSQGRLILDRLLVYGDKSELTHDSETEALVKALSGGNIQDGKARLLLYLVPRMGTISPWSSKATSIAAVCGLGEVVERIERGVLFSLLFDGEYKPMEERYPFADALHDRMTQVSP